MVDARGRSDDRSAVASIDLLVRELYLELRRLDLPDPSRLEYPLALDEIDASIAPARLPAAVRRLWELIDPDLMPVGMYPNLSTPEFGLQSRAMRDEIGAWRTARHFFQVFYESHDTIDVECDGPDWEGGCLFEYFVSDPEPLHLRYRSIEDWLEVMLAALRSGAYDERDSYVLLNYEAVDELSAVRLRSHAPHPTYGLETDFTSDQPAVWRERESQLPGPK